MTALIDSDRVWQAVLGHLEISLSRGNYVTWFKNTTLLKVENDTTIIGVPNIFIKNQLEKKYAPLIQEALAHNNLPTSSIVFKIHVPTATPKPQPTPSDEQTSAPRQSTLITTTPRPASSLTHAYRRGINK